MLFTKVLFIPILFYIVFVHSSTIINIEEEEDSDLQQEGHALIRDLIADQIQSTAQLEHAVELQPMSVAASETTTTTVTTTTTSDLVSLVILKSSRYVMQLIGVIISLCATAWIVENWISPTHATAPTPNVLYYPPNDKMYKNSITNTNEQSHNCNNGFGCNQHMCWRSCADEVHNANDFESWCFTSPDIENKRYYHRCNKHEDCSPCWNCLGVCHSQKPQQ